MKSLSIIGLLGVFVFCTSALWADTLTMTEVPFQPVNGLTVDGVTFHFSIGGVASNDANYNAGNGGIEKYVQDPSLEGNALGVLTIDFASPTNGVQFGVARSIGGPLTPGLSVDLFGSSLNPLGTFTLNTQVYFTFSEGLFVSPLTIGRAVLSFPSANLASRFAIDNLTSTPVPEPPTISLLSIGLAGLAAGCLRRKQTRREAVAGSGFRAQEIAGVDCTS